MTPIRFVSQLGALQFANAFNPYSDRCAVHDLTDAPVQRAGLLTEILEAAADAELDALWVGRDLGFRGGRRTGMALTDDVHFQDHLSRWGIIRSRPTIGQAVSERTATIIWDLLRSIDTPIFLWNVFPLHPHEQQNQFTNRAHNAKERKAGMDILDQLIRMLRPKRLVAVGNDAEKVLKQLSKPSDVLKVRHPSYGGQAEFSNKIRELYRIEANTLL
ncbi:uracil-DNA glycosylase [Sphingobium chlorophenolicum]|uniref:Uracil-DNA glycosylase n=1 Tax=Sphingobium chlorophenolicum TaxID=46429 RepID=A0A081RJE2_SPHCR|nr:uracil-DNA glycosylase [Sphingobium chlorophenolicum]KEQ55315.1 Uracil-DNA glycosylase [Sphingobium chlorophenolicum]